MRVLLVVITWIFLTASSVGAPFSDGKQYISLTKTIPDAPVVVEFFSFNCPHCYQFEQVMHLSEKVADNLPENTRLVKYHTEFIPPLGRELTQAWAVAMALGVEDKMMSPMFEAIQKKQNIQSIDDIRGVFINAGIKAEDFNGAWNSFAVKALMAKQEKAAADFALKGVPAMFIKGRYQLNTQGMESSSMNSFTHEYVETVKYLVESN